jgi:hypothetical protein
MSRKTVAIPAGWTPTRRLLEPLFACLAAPFGRPDPVEELRGQGWRLVGYDENGDPVFAPPARYSRWL